MADQLLFDSLVHASRDGHWLDADHFDASLERLLREARDVMPYRACLVNIAGFSDNDELAAIAAEHADLFVPIAGFDPSSCTDDARIDEAVGALAERPFAGIKLHPRLNDYDPLDGRCLYTIRRAAHYGLVVFLDTLFRQRTRALPHPADVIDKIAFCCPDTRIVLLHGGASAMLDIYEIVRMRANLLLDVSFTLMRYAGSSLDMDMRFLFETLDQRVTVGSDFPEYGLPQTRQRLQAMLGDLSAEKSANVYHANLERFLDGWLTRRV